MNIKGALLLRVSAILVFTLSSCELSLAQDITPPANYQRVSLERPSADAVFTLPDDSPSLVSGAAIFAESCAPCHGDTGTGGGAQAANLPTEPPQIGSAEVAAQASPVDWFGMITLGNIENLMPPFEENLSVQERWDVLAYVYSLSGSEQALEAVLPEGMQIVELPQPEPTEPVDSEEAPIAAETEESAAEDQVDETPDELEAPDALELGTVTGLITHGAGGDIPPELEVTLLGLDGLELVYSDSATIESDGSFVFEAVELTPDRIFFANVDYQGMSYGSQFDIMQDDDSLDLPISIYDTTKDSANLVIITLVIQVEFPTPEVVRLHYIYQVSNPTLETAIPAASGEPLMTYSLPQNALNFSFEQQISGDYFVLTEDGFGDTRSILAGSEEYTLAFGYELPYTRSLTLGLDLGWPVEKLVVLLPQDGPQVKNDFMTLVDETQFGSDIYQVYSGGSFQAGELQLEIAGRNPSAPPGFLGLDIDVELVVAISVFLVALVAAFMWTNRIRGVSQVAASETPEDIMDAIIALDEQYEAGKVADDVYQQRRQMFKSRLSDIL